MDQDKEGSNKVLTFLRQAGEENPKFRNAAPKLASTESVRTRFDAESGEPHPNSASFLELNSEACICVPKCSGPSGYAFCT